MIDNFERMIIHAKDIALISGVDKRTGYRILERIRKQLGKPPQGFVSISEFCAYMKLNPKEVKEYLR